MTGPKTNIFPIGRENEPLVTIDGFETDADALRRAALQAEFAPAENHYPGIRAPLPTGWLRARMPQIGAAIVRTFGRCQRVHIVDACFSIITTPPDQLTIKQRVPHADAFGRDRIAMILYLAPEGGDGTAFFRHRATGFETIDEVRAPTYFARLQGEIDDAEPPAAYIAGDTALFECTELAEARFNRALLYRSYTLHSGAIAPSTPIPADPATGRLTVTAFFTIE